MSPTAGQVITCKAAVCWSEKEPLSMESIQVDPPQNGEVRIRILFTALCHTDVTLWQDTMQFGIFPRILGHEAAGIIESVGDGVTELREGDHVLPVFVGQCDDCPHCKSEKSNVCDKFGADITRSTMLGDGESRFSIDGKRIGMFFGSTFSEYTVLEQQYVVKIDPLAPLKKACLLSCGVTTGFGSAWKHAKVHKGSTVAIFGLGTIGMAVAAGAKVAGASRIIGVDLNPQKFEKGKVFGVTEFINPKDHTDEAVHEVIKRMTNGGVDYSFECVGSARVVESAFLSCQNGGGLTVICGAEPGMQNTLNLHPNLFLHGKTLTGSLLGGIKPKTDLPKLMDLHMEELKLDEIITHERAFEEINEAFQLLLEGKCLRCVMHMEMVEEENM